MKSRIFMGEYLEYKKNDGKKILTNNNKEKWQILGGFRVCCVLAAPAKRGGLWEIDNIIIYTVS